MVTTGLDIGGAETHIVELCCVLADMGHDITVASAGGVYTKALAEKNIRHVTAPLSTKRPLAVIRSYKILKRLIDSEYFDVVHSHARIPSFILSCLHKKLGFRFVTTAHLDFKVTPIWKLLTSWGERTIAVSEDIKAYLVNNYSISPENISVTVNGIDMNKFSSKLDTSGIEKELSLDRNKKKIVYTSRIDTDRSLVAHHLCSIAPEVIRDFPDWEIIITGAGNDFEALKKDAEEANKAAGKKIITLTGARDDIYLFASLADVFIAVSRSALEFMSAESTGIIAGNQGYLGIFTESVLERAAETNFCCRGDGDPSPEKLKSDLYKLLNMSDIKRREMGEYNRSVIASRYSLDKMTQDYLKVYKELPPPTIFKNGEIMLLGYYGYKNTGDDCMLDTFVKALRSYVPSARLVSPTATPKIFTEDYGIKGIGRYNIFSIIKQCRNVKLLVVGGGSVLQDNTSRRSLYYYTSIMRMVKKSGGMVMLYGNGIGPLSPHGKKLVKKILQDVDRITLRDEDSAKLLYDLGVSHDKIKISADPALGMKPVSDKLSIAEKLGIKAQKKYITVALKGDEDFDSQAVFCATERICREYSLTPILISMQKSVDSELCRIGESYFENSILAEELNGSELAALYTFCRTGIGMRLHSVICSAIAGCVSVSVSYDPKIDIACRRLGLPEAVHMKDLTEDRVYSQLKSILSGNETFDKLDETVASLRAEAEADIREIVNLIMK